MLPFSVKLSYCCVTDNCMIILISFCFIFWTIWQNQTHCQYTRLPHLPCVGSYCCHRLDVDRNQCLTRFLYISDRPTRFVLFPDQSMLYSVHKHWSWKIQPRVYCTCILWWMGKFQRFSYHMIALRRSIRNEWLTMAFPAFYRQPWRCSRL